MTLYMNTINIAICTTNWLPGITLSEASKLASIPYFLFYGNFHNDVIYLNS